MCLPPCVNASLAGPRLLPPRGEGLDTCLQASCRTLQEFLQTNHIADQSLRQVRVLLLAVSALRNQTFLCDNSLVGMCPGFPLSAAEAFTFYLTSLSIVRGSMHIKISCFCNYMYVHVFTCMQFMTYINFASRFFKVRCKFTESQTQLSIHRTIAWFIDSFVIYLQYIHMCSVYQILDVYTHKACTHVKKHGVCGDCTNTL